MGYHQQEYLKTKNKGHPTLLSWASIWAELKIIKLYYVKLYGLKY